MKELTIEKTINQVQTELKFNMLKGINQVFIVKKGFNKINKKQNKLN